MPEGAAAGPRDPGAWPGMSKTWGDDAMKTRSIGGTRGARRAGAVWGVLFLAAAACGPAFPATLEWGTYLGGSGGDGDGICAARNAAG